MFTHWLDCRRVFYCWGWGSKFLPQDNCFRCSSKLWLSLSVRCDIAMTWKTTHGVPCLYPPPLAALPPSSVSALLGLPAVSHVLSSSSHNLYSPFLIEFDRHSPGISSLILSGNVKSPHCIWSQPLHSFTYLLHLLTLVWGYVPWLPHYSTLISIYCKLSSPDLQISVRKFLPQQSSLICPIWF